MNTNYVKKVVFPIEILPIVALGNALFQAIISYIVLLLFCLIYYEILHWTVLFAPLIIFPFLLFLLGMGLFLSALGVFIRDISQIIGVLVTGMMFLSPLFFPLSALPEGVRPYIYLNPLTFIMQQLREVTLWGNCPDWLGLLLYFIISCVICVLGFFFFTKTKKGFADVL
jgi:lipopolysaccharide transport system permease protein